MLDKAPKVTAVGKPAVGYLRRSTDRQEQSLGDQRRSIEDYARHHVFEILDWYEDDAVSGASVEARSGFRRMLECARSPQRDWRFILVYDVSRFSRGSLDEAGHVRYQFKQMGVEVVYCAEGFSGNDSDELVRGVRQWQAQQYVKDLSKVTIRGLLSLSEGGWCMGGLAPYGYDHLYYDSMGKPYHRVRYLPTGEKQVFSVEGTLIRTIARGQRFRAAKSDRAKLVSSEPQRVRTVQRIFEMYADGCMGLRSIAAKLNEEKIASPGCANPKANPAFTWCLSSVRGILQNPVYTGDLSWNKTTQAKFNRIADGQAQKRETVRRVIEKNRQQDWIVVPGTHEALVPRSLFERAKARRSDDSRTKDNFRRGRGRTSSFLLTSLMTCKPCGSKIQGHTRNTGAQGANGSEIRSHLYICGSRRSRGRGACKPYYLRRDPFESFILGRVEARLQKYLARGGMERLRKLIAEEVIAKVHDPRQEIDRIKSDLARLQAEADRLLDVITPATADFVGERLGKVRVQRQAQEARLAELERVTFQPVDLEAAVTAAVAHMERFQEVLNTGTIEQRKEFLRGFIHGITVDPETKSGVITFYELPAGSVMMVPGPRVALLRSDRFGLPDHAWRVAV